MITDGLIRPHKPGMPVLEDESEDRQIQSFEEVLRKKREKLATEKLGAPPDGQWGPGSKI